MLDARDDAEKENRASLTAFATLAQAHPDVPDHRQALGNSYNALGELLRLAFDRHDDAEKAYGEALTLQTALVQQHPAAEGYRQELARTHYNRGILYGAVAGPHDDSFRAADADFREAIRLLEPLAQKAGNAQASQELARAYNNLAALLAQGAEDRQGLEAARPLYERAIATHTALTSRDPGNREFKFELAKFSNNYSELLRELGAYEPAERHSANALRWLQELVRPAPSLGIEQADAHNLRGRILQSAGSTADAVAEYRTSLQLFQTLARTDEAAGRPDFHLRYGDLLTNLAVLRRERPAGTEPRRLLTEALRTYLDFGLRSRPAASGEGKAVFDTLARVMPEIGEADRAAFTESYGRLQQQVTARQ
jgi:tetratricopeptide (TPR) repeat protein